MWLSALCTIVYVSRNTRLKSKYRATLQADLTGIILKGSKYSTYISIPPDMSANAIHPLYSRHGVRLVHPSVCLTSPGCRPIYQLTGQDLEYCICLEYALLHTRASVLIWSLHLFTFLANSCANNPINCKYFLLKQSKFQINVTCWDSRFIFSCCLFFALCSLLPALCPLPPAIFSLSIYIYIYLSLSLSLCLSRSIHPWIYIYIYEWRENIYIYIYI